MTIFHAFNVFLNTIIHCNSLEYIKGLFQYPNLEKKKGEKVIFFLMTPNYGNVGDQAISFATTLFIRQYFPDYKVVEVSLGETCKYLPILKKIAGKEDVIILQGGGNMGDLYRDIDNIRLFAVNKLRKKRIVSMPVTVSYSNSMIGRIHLLRSKLVYSKCGDLTIIARDNDSFDLLQREFKSNTILVSPDIALFLSGKVRFQHGEKKGIIVAIRQDKESNLNRGREEFLKRIIDRYNDVFLLDTTVDRRITKEMREKEVFSMLNIISNSKLLVTDRMHGMIFASLVNVKCLAICEKNGKIKNAYNWINPDSCKLVDSDEEVEAIIKKMDSMLKSVSVEKEKQEIEVSALERQFDELARTIRDI